LRYWEQEFSQLKPTTRRGNRRYYQQHDVLLIRKIRRLLYQEGFTISGAAHQLAIDKKQQGEIKHTTTTAELKELREELEALSRILEK
jgi:DNA-binding transcriptional MerR regulator